MGHLIYNANIDHSATFVYRIKLPRHVENVIMQAMSLNFALAQQKHSFTVDIVVMFMNMIGSP